MNKLPICNFILLLLPIVFITSCKVEKRLYRPGYHVEWKGQKAKSFTASVSDDAPRTNENTVTNRINSDDEEDDNMLDLSMMASVHQNMLQSAENVSAKVSFTKTSKFSKQEMPCDTVQLLSNERLIVRLTEITLKDVKYKRCDLPQGPLYVVPLKDVDFIIYGNGDVDYIADPPLTETEPIVPEAPEVAEQSAEQLIPEDKPETKRKLEILGLIAFVLSLGAMFLYIYLALPAMILAVVSLLRHNNNDHKFMGKGFAQASLFISILAFVIYLMVGPFIVF